MQNFSDPNAHYITLRRWYHRQPKHWKKENPDPHSCMMCIYLRKKLCERRVFSLTTDIARYYPNQCTQFEILKEV